jgi:hypothetical protein
MYPQSLIDHNEYISYFANVETLQLVDVGLANPEYASTLIQLKSTVRFLEFDFCSMNVGNLVTFLRPFTGLEGLSFCYPGFRNPTKLETQGELPALKGQLVLDFSPFQDTSPFLREFSLLPLAFSSITLVDRANLNGGLDYLLNTCRETLAAIRVEKSTPPLT